MTTDMTTHIDTMLKYRNVDACTSVHATSAWNAYAEGHRFFHTALHVFDVMDQIEANCADLSDWARQALHWAALFHEGVPLNVPVVHWTGMLDQLVSHLKDDWVESVTVVRGLRGASDLDTELTQRTFVQQLAGSKVPYTFFVSDPSLSHISSSAVRTLKGYQRDVSAYLP